MNRTELLQTQKHGHSRVTYHALNRTFDRLFKENSLKEMQDAVRRKLGLPENALVILSQVRGGQLIDLEDDDDFDAFHAVIHSVRCVDVKVTLQTAVPPITTQTITPNAEETEDSINHRKRKVAFSENEDPIWSPSIDVDQVLPPSKRRRSNSVSKSKHPEVNQHDCPPSNDDSSVRIGHSANSNSSDEDVVMEPSSSSVLPPPSTFNDTSIIAASDITVTDFDQTMHSLAAPALPEAKRKQKRVNKALEGANSRNKEEISTQSERKNKKEMEKPKVIETPSNQENTASAETLKIPERKKRKKKPRLAKEVMESELPNQDTVSLSMVERFPQQLADAISKNADGEQREKDRKKRKKGKKTEPDKTDARPSGAMNGDFHDEVSEPPVPSGKAAEDAAPDLPKKKKTNAKQKAKFTPKNSSADGKKSEQSAEMLLVKETVQEMLRKNAESSRSCSSKAPRVDDKSTMEHSKPQISSNIRATTAVQTFGESDSDDSIQAMRLAAQQRYTKRGKERTLPDIDIEEVIRGPSVRRLTLDKVIGVDIVGQRKEKGVILEEEETPTRRRSIAARLASSDSEMEADGEEDSMKEDQTTNTPKEPPVLLPTSVDKMPDAVYPTISNWSTSSTEPDDDSQDVNSKGETDEVVRPSVDRQEDAEELSNSRTSLPRDVPDPIEPIPSPARETSPIQASQGDVHVSPVNGLMTKRGGTALSAIPAPRTSRKRRKSISNQPVSVHETAVRESVAKMTRSRTKLAANTLSRKGPSPSAAPEPQEPEAPGKDTPEPTRTTHSLGDLDQTGDDNVPHEAWTALDDMSPTEPESSLMMIDQLRSSLEPEPDSPLFLSSETQPGFPFSQWRDAQLQGANGLAHSPRDSQDEEEVVASVTSQRKRPSAPPTFRSLTQIASQPKIYSSSPLLPPSMAPQVTKKELYGSVANGYGDESESSSESEEEISHIPKSRQAGKKSL
ncbi:hypothetical protein E1B28_000621 [Marasmius oreades]|uniref:Uncharacterized protein n=1 Tax=Marasmius oreades TaxID=181124 RepID=A0A9P7V1P3_9AGAR|nr:uncharacterized protein E1B28_000621 [Marasmius oreades]KAG7098708.1 hypothetical protein E1B28_000621 [Marasmius oreades]